MTEIIKISDYPGTFVEIIDKDEIYEGEAKLINKSGYEILVVNVSGEFRAYYARCAHAFGLLEPSSFDGEKITCPVHLWEYDAKTGESINPEGSSLFQLELKIEDNRIYVKVPTVSSYEFKVKYLKMYNEKEG